MNTVDNKKELLSKIEPLIEFSVAMLNAGTLTKNVVRHWTNKGLSLEASENIKDLAVNRYKQFSKYSPK